MPNSFKTIIVSLSQMRKCNSPKVNDLKLWIGLTKENMLIRWFGRYGNYFFGGKKSCGEKRFRDSIDGIKLVIEPPLWSWYSFGIFLLNRIFYWRGAVWSSLMSRWPAGRCSSMHLIKSTAAPVTWKAANERAVTNKTPDLYRILPGFTGFYWVLLAFTRFY